MTQRFEVREASSADLAGILAVQHEAFGRVATSLRIDPEALPPLRETVDDLVSLHADGVRFWVAVSHERVIGSVRASVTDDVVQLGRLVVDADHLRRGVASELMDALENSYPGAIRFELFTGADAAAPLALYRGRGYQEDRTEQMGPVTLVWLAKQGPAALR